MTTSSAVTPNEIPQLKHREYSAFVSYRHADNKESGRQWATWLQQTLETFEIPSGLIGTNNKHGEIIPSGLYPVFRDEEELPAESELSKPIENALRHSRSLIVICSPASAESRFVNDEIQTFKKLGKAARVLAVIIRGEPNAADDPSKCTAGVTAKDECFPLALRRKLDDAGQISDQTTEPIAADFRTVGQTEGWTTPEGYRDQLERIDGLSKKEIKVRTDKYGEQCTLMKLKIIAGVLGVPLGELTRRDQAYQLKRARERQRITLVVAAALAILLFLALAGGVTSIIKQHQIQNALKEQHRMSFEAVARNAQVDDAKGGSEHVIQELKPFLADDETDSMHVKARQWVEKAQYGYKRFEAFAKRLRASDVTASLELGDGLMMQFVRIEQGTFEMGSPETEDGHFVKDQDDQKATNEVQHSVVITSPFYIGKFDVTQEQYEMVMGENPSIFNGKLKNPVEMVSWFDAVGFCDKLSAQSGPVKMRISLPTEAQWEYACRAGTQTPYYFGNDAKELPNYAWFKENAGFLKPNYAYGTNPVGSKRPNAWELYDMNGNVFQWCQDYYDKDYYLHSPKEDPGGPLTGTMQKAINSNARVLRGGSWNPQTGGNAGDCRSAYRYYRDPRYRSYHVGFRVVVAVSSFKSP